MVSTALEEEDLVKQGSSVSQELSGTKIRERKLLTNASFPLTLDLQILTDFVKNILVKHT